MPGSERRRARCVLGLVALACAAVIAAGRDTAAYLYHRHHIRDDFAAMCEALFADADGARGRAAREIVHAHVWEKVFARDVAGKDWAVAQVVEDGSGQALFKIERKLRADPDGDCYRIWRYLRHSRDSLEVHLNEIKRIARLRGPFLFGLEGAGWVTSWGVMDGKLILGSLVRITARDWVLLHSSTSTQGADTYTFLRFSFDRDLEPGAQGICNAWGKEASKVPLIGSPGTGAISANDLVHYVVTAQPDAGVGRVVVEAGAARFRLHLDTNLGIGWHERWSSFVYEEDRAGVAKP